MFAPGTTNRIVTVTGQPDCIATARSLIERKAAESTRVTFGVEESRVKEIIGVGGQTVVEIEQTSGAKVCTVYATAP